jgi:SAM-dependent methyltransferase
MTADDWTEYYRATEDRPPRQQLFDVLATFPQPGMAVDLGCGAGGDTAAMLAAGWSVFATDAQQEAIDRVRGRVPEDAPLTTAVARMEEVELPVADLVWASYSLFFCDPTLFPQVWTRVREAVRPGGRFAGQVLGDRDTWTSERRMPWFRRDAAEALFDGWSIERFDVEEEDGEAWSAPKHWHVFHIVAQRPSPRPA